MIKRQVQVGDIVRVLRGPQGDEPEVSYWSGDMIVEQIKTIDIGPPMDRCFAFCSGDGPSRWIACSALDIKD